MKQHIVRPGDAAVNSIARKWPWVLAVPLLLVMSLASASSATTPPSEFAIQEWPTNLRNDLRGTSVKVVLPENALDRPWDDALMEKFHELTGITVQTVSPGNDTTAVLAGYLRDFANGSANADVYAIDIVWPGILSDYAEDLRPLADGLQDMLPALIHNDTVKGKLVAIPYFTEVSLLYFRRAERSFADVV